MQGSHESHVFYVYKRVKEEVTIIDTSTKLPDESKTTKEDIDILIKKYNLSKDYVNQINFLL